ncbi:MAG: 2-oxo acid dehydrogenase subunit E2 [Deltaproteobacteria bacterium]|nr:2-oxo acid dehydrogenase subunit E2 [Deltaproteobacteria bacterium]
MGLTMTTAQVARWLKNAGDPVKKGEPVVEVMTDKLSNLIESPQDGVLLKIVALAGVELQAGMTLGFIGQAGEEIPETQAVQSLPAASDLPEPAAQAAPAVPSGDGAKILATPVAKALAKDQGVDLTQVKGTGPGGRITKEDLTAFLESKPSAEAGVQSAESSSASLETLKIIPYTGLRQIIGRNLHRSWSEIPRVTLHCQVQADALLEMRLRLNEGGTKEERITVTDLLAKAIAAAVQKHPEINSLFDGHEIKVMREVNLGVAIALPGALVVPVVAGVGSKTLRTVSSEIKTLSAKARGGTLGPDDMAGGTLTLTNLGSYNSVDTFNPIINPPQVAIIGVGRTRQVPVVKNGQIVPAAVFSLSVTHDHRVLDGAPVAAFMAALSELIEEPLKILA